LELENERECGGTKSDEEKCDDGVEGKMKLGFLREEEEDNMVVMRNRNSDDDDALSITNFTFFFVFSLGFDFGSIF
jgi:hypothetical protein